MLSAEFAQVVMDNFPHPPQLKQSLNCRSEWFRLVLFLFLHKNTSCAEVVLMSTYNIPVCFLCTNTKNFSTFRLWKGSHLELCIEIKIWTIITKTYLSIFDPLKPHFYIVKLEFTGEYISFLISAQKHRLWVLVRTTSLRWFYRAPKIYVLSRNMKNIRFFYLKIFFFGGKIFSIFE